MKARVLSLSLVLALSLGSSPIFAAEAEVGAACPKINLKTDSLICIKINGKLKWQFQKMAQTISYTAVKRVPNNEKRIGISYSASSGLAVGAESLTPNICSVKRTSRVVLLTGNIGLCSIKLTQGGNAKFLRAKPVSVRISIVGFNSISFSLPPILAFTRGTYKLTATSRSGLPVVFTTSTPEVCSVNDITLVLHNGGSCVVTATQRASQFYEAASSVTRNIEVSLSRVSSDQPDLISGFQIKAVYVVPSDGEDNSYDINDRILDILKEGNKFLGEELGRTLPIDSTATGFDISFLKSSKPSRYFMTDDGGNAQLLAETRFLESPSPNRKLFVFFVDVPVVKAQRVCGYSSTPGVSLVMAIGQGSCTSQTPFFSSYASTTWVHEVFHNLGVKHVPDPCDLMASGDPMDGPLCSSGKRETIDRNYLYYVNSDKYGVDILRLRVWQGQTEDMSLEMDCVRDPAPRKDGLHYAYCSTGTRVIGALLACWSSIYSVWLEEYSDGAWRSLGEGSFDLNFWRGELSGWFCADPRFVTPWKTVTVDTPGIRHYRWKINGDLADELNIIWVK